MMVVEWNAEEERQKAWALAEGMFSANVVISEFVETTLRDVVAPAVKMGTADEALADALDRIDAWLMTFRRLSKVSDYQATSAGCRAILEAAIDIVMLRAKPSDHEKVRAWEDSAKLVQASAVTEYLKTAGPDQVKQYSQLIRYATTQKARIDGERRRFGWEHPKNKNPVHPQRWTGCGRDLLQDAREADKHQDEFGFEEFYQTRYRELCWTTHGSGQIALRGVQSEYVPVWGARCFRECGFMAMLSLRIVLEHLGLYDAQMKAKLEHAAGIARLTEHESIARAGFAKSYFNKDEAGLDG